MARSAGTNRRLGLASALGVVSALGCAPAPKSGEDSAALASFAVASLPDDARPTFFDFGGKVRIIGYSVSPDGDAAPGSAVHLKLYWQRVSPLSPGWSLFTHVEDDGGKQLRNFDREGAFRTALASKPEGLALLDIGKTYVDEQALEVPKAEDVTPKIAVVVGAWSDVMRLPVLSGTTNGHDAALVARFSTGVPRRTPAPPSNPGARP